MFVPVALLVGLALPVPHPTAERPFPKPGETVGIPAKSDDWTGKIVVATKRTRDVRFGGWAGGKPLTFVSDGLMVCEVFEDRGGFLRVYDGLRKGWVSKSDYRAADEGLTHWQRVAEADPTDAFAAFVRGIVRSGFPALTKDTPAALADAFQLDPANAAFHAFRGILQSEAARSLADLEKAVRLDPADAYAHFKLAEAYAKTGRPHLALEEYGEILRLHPYDPLGYANRGLVWGMVGEHKKAMADLDNAIRLDEADAISLGNRGYIRLLIDRTATEAALADLNESVRLDPNSPDALNNRAFVRSLRKEYKKAMADCDAALKLNPRHPGALANKAVTHARLREYTEAHLTFGLAVGSAPTANTLADAAWFYATCSKDIFRDGKAALEYATRASELDPNSANIRGALAAAYAATGDFAMAETVQGRLLGKMVEVKAPAADVKKVEATLETYRARKPHPDEYAD